MIKYAIRDKKTLKLFSFEIFDTSRCEVCGATSTKLTLDDDAPTLTFSTLEQARRAINVNTPWYNSTLETPGWGRYKREQFEIVEYEIIIRTLDVQPIEYVEFDDNYIVCDYNDYFKSKTYTKSKQLDKYFKSKTYTKSKQLDKEIKARKNLFGAVNKEMDVNEWIERINETLYFGDSLIKVVAVMHLEDEKYEYMVVYEKAE
jgi:hypothetical protein